MSNLSDAPLIADVYYIVAGTKEKEGAVITRDRLNASDVWRLSPPERWFEVETSNLFVMNLLSENI